MYATTLTNEGEMAMAVEPSMPSALDLSEEWLCDTGAAYDLVPRDVANIMQVSKIQQSQLTSKLQMALIAPTLPCL